MKIEEWRTSADPLAMLEWAWKRMSGRKRRLFAVAGARLRWDELPDIRSRATAEVIERFADGLATEAELEQARMEADNAQFDRWQEEGGSQRTGDLSSEWYAMLWPMWGAGVQDLDGYRADSLSSRGTPPEAQAGILRDLVRRPGRKKPLAKPGPDAERMARHAYESRDWAVLPVLADALEEEGCTDAELLAHLRSGAVHVRGCWALDLVLGKG